MNSQGPLDPTIRHTQFVWKGFFVC